jgi:Mg-chelatase subunit ChlD
MTTPNGREDTQMKLTKSITYGVLFGYLSLLSPAYAKEAPKPVSGAAAPARFPPAPRPTPKPEPKPETVKPPPAPPVAKAKAEAPRVEVVFVLDTTGSMGGLIEGAKEKIWSISNEIMRGKPAPEVKIGLVAYRDKGDDYVTKTTDLTGDLDKVYSILMGFDANGGGDGPEHVNQGLKDAIETMSWSKDKKAVKMIFLVGDAPPHEDYGDQFTHKSLAKKAIEKGIVVNTIRCGTDPTTETFWQAIALAADGSYFSIEQTGGMAAVATPYDTELAELGAKLDTNTVSYGETKEREEAEKARNFAADSAAGAASEVAAARAVAKGLSSSSGSLAYTNDVISELEAGRIKIADVKAENLPAEVQKLSAPERTKYLEGKLAERKELRAKIQAADKKRNEYIAEQEKKAEEAAKESPSAAPAAPKSFDRAVRESIHKEGKKNGIDY